jgi:protein CpxP
MKFLWGGRNLDSTKQQRSKQMLIAKELEMKRSAKVLVMALGLMGLATACHFNKTPQEKANYITGKVQKKLDLNEEQKAKLDKLADKVVKLHSENKGTKEVFYQDVKKLVLQNEVKEEEVRALMERKRTHIEAILPQVLPEILEFHASLDLNQKEKLVSLMEKFKKRHRKFNH